MRVLVTGAGGRLGRKLVQALYAKEFQLVLLDRDAETVKESLKNSGAKAGAKIIQCDIASCDEEALARALAGVDAVVHLAALLDYSAPRAKIFAVNVEGTRKLAAASKKAGVKRFVFASSTSVWRGARGLLDEESSVQPVNAYGESKLLAEGVLEKSGLPYVILRIALIYGQGFEEGFKQVVLLVKKKRMPLIGSGRNRIGFVHVDDVVQAFLLALTKKEALNQTFLIASGENLSQKKLLETLARELGAPAPRMRVPKFLAYFAAWLSERGLLFGGRLRREHVGTLCEDRCYDITKARRVLGFKPRVEFEKALGEVIESFGVGARVEEKRFLE